MKNILVTICFLIISTMYAQDPMLQKDHPNLEKQAYEITREYNEQLALDGDQVILFQKKVEEFLIRRQDIEKTLEGKEKLTALLNMQIRETGEMKDILTRNQLMVYEKIKPEIQPLDTVEDKN